MESINPRNSSSSRLFGCRKVENRQEGQPSWQQSQKEPQFLWCDSIQMDTGKRQWVHSQQESQGHSNWDRKIFRNVQKIQDFHLQFVGRREWWAYPCCIRLPRRIYLLHLCHLWCRLWWCQPAHLPCRSWWRCTGCSSSLPPVGYSSCSSGQPAGCLQQSYSSEWFLWFLCGTGNILAGLKHLHQDSCIE